LNSNDLVTVEFDNYKNYKSAQIDFEKQRQIVLLVIEGLIF